VSRGEGELLTVPKPRAVGLLSACLTVKPVGEPDALIGHVRFDERGMGNGALPNGLSYRAYPRLYQSGQTDHTGFYRYWADFVAKVGVGKSGATVSMY
jgi:hypothetical protein